MILTFMLSNGGLLSKHFLEQNLPQQFWNRFRLELFEVLGMRKEHFLKK
jgi:hypothetical protein